MKHLRLALALSLALASGAVAEDRPLITLPVRVHLMQSDTTPDMHTTLTDADVLRILGKVNTVWSQAGIRFEIESIVRTKAVELTADIRGEEPFAKVKAMIPAASLSPTAIDVCYVKRVQPNGFYAGELIVVKDTASLREVEGGIDEPLPRVTSHELGHALGLPHRQDTFNLMASGTTGTGLNDEEIFTARARAQKRLTEAPTPETPTE